MIDVILETLIDSIKLVPFLFIAFLVIELIEHKFSRKTKNIVTKSEHFGPLLGGLLGLFPQCGFSVMATNLYITRIITLGTLISIYLTTSDEMLPILLSHNVELPTIIKLLGIKLIVGIFCGFIIDFILRKKNKNQKATYEICDEEHCHCGDGLILSTVKHTLNTVLFIMIISFILNLLLTYVGEDYLSKIFMKDNIFGSFIASIIGLIPNCGASVMITELYLNNAISLGATMAGLLTGSGVAVLVLFKSNKNIKENLTILAIIYGIGVISGIILDIVGVVI